MGSVFCLFFFKQKTAYDMRISDWSSDVCSSDLAELAELRRAVNVPVAAGERCFSRFDIANLVNAAAVDVLQPDVAHIGGVKELVARKSVVEGKGVSVRVDIGGRRIIKKKKQDTTRRNRDNQYTRKTNGTH